MSDNTTRGDMTEQALLKFVLQHFPKRCMIFMKKGIKVLHWQNFNKLNNMSTVVLKVMKEEAKAGKQDGEDNITEWLEEGADVFVLSMGDPKKIKEICPNYYLDNLVKKDMDDDIKQTIKKYTNAGNTKKSVFMSVRTLTDAEYSLEKDKAIAEYQTKIGQSEEQYST